LFCGLCRAAAGTSAPKGDGLSATPALGPFLFVAAKIMPGVAPGTPAKNKEKDKNVEGHHHHGSGNGGGPQDTLIQALIEKLPPAGPWSADERVNWLKLLTMAFQIAYGHVKLADDPYLLEEGKSHAARRSREPDHGHCHADQANPVCEIHDRPGYCGCQIYSKSRNVPMSVRRHSVRTKRDHC
jgi:hypothetical protein